MLRISKLGDENPFLGVRPAGALCVSRLAPGNTVPAKGQTDVSEFFFRSKHPFQDLDLQRRSLRQFGHAAMQAVGNTRVRLFTLALRF